MADYFDTPVGDITEPQPLPSGSYKVKIGAVFLPKPDAKAEVVTVRARPIQVIDTQGAEVPEDYKSHNLSAAFFTDGQVGQWELRQFVDAALAGSENASYPTLRAGLALLKGKEIFARVFTKQRTMQDGTKKPENAFAIISDPTEDMTA